MQKTKTGFTLIELLIVIGMLSILYSISIIGFKNKNHEARDANKMHSVRVLANIIAYDNATEENEMRFIYTAQEM